MQARIGVDLELRSRGALDGGAERQPLLARPVDAEMRVALGLDPQPSVEADAPIALGGPELYFQPAADIQG